MKATHVKHLYSVGNLWKGGYPFGVETEDFFGSRELHGPFGNEREAERYAHALNGEFDDYALIQVVKIETPSIGMPIKNKLKREAS